MVQLHESFQTSNRYDGECRNVKLKLASRYVAWVVSCFSRFTIQITMRLVLRQDCLLVALDDPLGPGIDSALVVGSPPSNQAHLSLVLLLLVHFQVIWLLCVALADLYIYEIPVVVCSASVNDRNP